MLEMLLWNVKVSLKLKASDQTTNKLKNIIYVQEKFLKN